MMLAAQGLQVVGVRRPAVLPLDTVIDLRPRGRAATVRELARSVAILDEAPQPLRRPIRRPAQTEWDAVVIDAEPLPRRRGDGEIASCLRVDQPIPLQHGRIIGRAQECRRGNVHDDLRGRSGLAALRKDGLGSEHALGQQVGSQLREGPTIVGIRVPLAAGERVEAREHGEPHLRRQEGSQCAHAVRLGPERHATILSGLGPPGGDGLRMEPFTKIPDRSTELARGPAPARSRLELRERLDAELFGKVLREVRSLVHDGPRVSLRQVAGLKPLKNLELRAAEKLGSSDETRGGGLRDALGDSHFGDRERMGEATVKALWLSMLLLCNASGLIFAGKPRSTAKASTTARNERTPPMSTNTWRACAPVSIEGSGCHSAPLRSESGRGTSTTSPDDSMTEKSLPIDAPIHRTNSLILPQDLERVF